MPPCTYVYDYLLPDSGDHLVSCLALLISQVLEHGMLPGFKERLGDTVYCWQQGCEDYVADYLRHSGIFQGLEREAPRRRLYGRLTKENMA